MLNFLATSVALLLSILVIRCASSVRASTGTRRNFHRSVYTNDCSREPKRKKRKHKYEIRLHDSRRAWKSVRPRRRVNVVVCIVSTDLLELRGYGCSRSTTRNVTGTKARHASSPTDWSTVRLSADPKPRNSTRLLSVQRVRRLRPFPITIRGGPGRRGHKQTGERDGELGACARCTSRRDSFLLLYAWHSLLLRCLCRWNR